MRDYIDADYRAQGSWSTGGCGGMMASCKLRGLMVSKTSGIPYMILRPWDKLHVSSLDAQITRAVFSV